MNPEVQNQGLASAVNRCLLLENKVRNLELEKAILLDVVTEAKKFIKQTTDLGHHLVGLKNMLERAERIVPGG